MSRSWVGRVSSAILLGTSVVQAYEAPRTKARQDLEVLRQAVQLYEQREGLLRGTDLRPLVGRYLQELPPDPWGRPYLYDGQVGAVVSWGSDGVAGDEVRTEGRSWVREDPEAADPEDLVVYTRDPPRLEAAGGYAAPDGAVHLELVWDRPIMAWRGGARGAGTPLASAFLLVSGGGSMFVAKGTSWPLTDEGLGGPTLQAHLERDGRTVTMRLPRPRDAGRAWSALSTWGPRLRLDEAAAAASGLVEAPVAGGDPPSPFEARFGARARAFLRGGVEGEDGGTPLELRRARSDQPERYHLMKPEAHLIRTETALRRTGGQTEVSIHVDGVTGQLSLAAPGGSPLRYARFDHLTHSLGRAVFAAGGQYLFAYDDQSYLVVRPTTRLGWGEFGEYDLLNFYSRDPARVARASEDELVEWLRARWLEAREAAQR